MIVYQNHLNGIGPEQLADGFCKGWSKPLTQDEHMTILRNSTHVILAIDEATGRVIGFINALTDGVRFAFIPMVEVLDAHRLQGIGSQLMVRMLETLEQYGCIDLVCDAEQQPFYERFSMIRSYGMTLRDYL